MLVTKGPVGHLVHPDHIQVHGHWVNSPPKRSYSASCVESDSCALKIAWYLRTVSESTLDDGATIPNFCMRTHWACLVESASRGLEAMRSLRHSDVTGTGVRGLRNLSSPRMRASQKEGRAAPPNSPESTSWSLREALRYQQPACLNRLHLHLPGCRGGWPGPGVGIPQPAPPPGVMALVRFGLSYTRSALKGTGPAPGLPPTWPGT
jgi:hypothetical protein